MLPSYFDYTFVQLKQKVRFRPELSSKCLSTLGPNPARTRPDPKSPARLITLVWAKTFFGLRPLSISLQNPVYAIGSYAHNFTPGFIDQM